MKRVSLILLFVGFLFSCTQDNITQAPEKKPEPVENTVQAFQNLIDESALNGAILLYNPKGNQWYSNDFKWAKTPRLPASTFKIPHSMIALETGVVADTNTVFKWDGKARALQEWEQDLNFSQAFRKSCVPCYQEIAAKIGLDRMKEQLRQLNYGHMDVDEAKLTSFWLEGNSCISPQEQVLFLERFYNGELPISKRTENIVKDMMLLEKTADYTLRGKTGWAIQKGKNNVWFVGCVETKEELFYFATNLSPIATLDPAHLAKIRKEITKEALQLQGIIPK